MEARRRRGGDGGDGGGVEVREDEDGVIVIGACLDSAIMHTIQHVFIHTKQHTNQDINQQWVTVISEGRVWRAKQVACKKTSK